MNVMSHLEESVHKTVNSCAVTCILRMSRCRGNNQYFFYHQKWLSIRPSREETDYIYFFGFQMVTVFT